MRMKVSDVMTSHVRLVSPNETISEAARLMADVDAGAMPVGDNDRLVGMITDRDIAVRAVANGLGPDTKVREVMSNDICYCFEDEDIDHIANNMADLQVRRLPVVNRQKRLVGIVSLGDIAVMDGPDSAGDALCGISEPGGQHSQTGTIRGAL
jgi:CBS domain-containing protein